MKRKTIMLPKDLLYQKYIINQLSTPEIGREYNMSARSIFRQLEKYGIKTRTIKESRKIADERYGYPMAGKKHSEETKKKMSLVAKGRPKSLEHCRKMSKIFSGPGSGRWKGGHIFSEGYHKVWIKPKHYKKNARVIAEDVLGRSLKKDEIIHHINGNRQDDRKENLMICSRSYHMELHQRMKKLAEIL